MSQHENPIVFISYSQDSSSHSDRVLDFSNKLRSEGIDAILDQYEEAPPEGWPRWMDNSINKADYVIIIGSEGYDQKIRGANQFGKGLGVKWEGNIIYQMLYKNDTLNEKLIPAVFNEDDAIYIPSPLQSSTYYNISYKKDFDSLYWRLRGISTKEKPPLGELRPLQAKERKTHNTFDKTTLNGNNGKHGKLENHDMSETHQSRSVIDILGQFYQSLSEFRESINTNDTNRINPSASKMKKDALDLYAVGEKCRYSNPRLSEIVLSIICQYNLFVDLYKEFVNSEDRLSHVAQQYASQADREFQMLINAVLLNKQLLTEDGLD